VAATDDAKNWFVLVKGKQHGAAARALPIRKPVSGA
jgi:hypothetical protein